MATLADFRSHVSTILGTDDTAGGTDEGLIDDCVNEAVQDVLLKTSCYVTAADSALTDGTNDYTISTALLKVIGAKLTSGSTTYDLERKTVDEILDLRRNADYKSTPYCYAIAGANMLMLYPTPDSSSDSIRFYYVPSPTAMSLGTHDPSNTSYGGIPPERHKLIEWYTLWLVADYDDDISSSQGELYLKRYENGIKEFRRVIRQKGSNRLPRAHLRNLRKRANVPVDPSRTWSW